MKEISILVKGNEGKNLEIEVDGVIYQRFPIKTHLIRIKEDINPIFEQIKKKYFQEGNFLAISEKFIAISEGRLIHKSIIKPSGLAKLLVKGVKKYENDTGFSNPLKMQIAIMQAGYVRIFFAAVIGMITRLLGRRGDFYRIAGNRISEIDGFDPATVKPFDEFATLGPENPQEVAQKIKDKFGMSTVIVDSNNINTEVLGKNFQIKYSSNRIRRILLDNPMCQGAELTPIILIRKKK